MIITLLPSISMVGRWNLAFPVLFAIILNVKTKGFSIAENLDQLSNLLLTDIFSSYFFF